MKEDEFLKNMNEMEILDKLRIDEDNFIEETLNIFGSIRKMEIENQRIIYGLWTDMHEEYELSFDNYSKVLKEWILKQKPSYYSISSGFDIKGNYNCNIGNGSVVMEGKSEFEAILNMAIWIFLLKNS